MSLLLLDSNIIRLLGPIPAEEQPLLALYWSDLRGHEYAISFQTHAESLKGAYLDGWGLKRVAHLEARLSRFFLIYPDQETLKVWAMLVAHAQKKGRRLAGEDAWIGATAVQHQLPLISHDQDLVGLDFPGLVVINRVSPK